jgi:hypothetical protein
VVESIPCRKIARFSLECDALDRAVARARDDAHQRSLVFQQENY